MFSYVEPEKKQNIWDIAQDMKFVYRATICIRPYGCHSRKGADELYIITNITSHVF